MRSIRFAAWVALAFIGLVAICPDFFATYPPTRQYRNLPYAAPGFYNGASLHWFVSGEPYYFLGIIPASRRLIGSPEPGRIFLLGSDEFGRDWYSRLCHGASISLLVAPLAAVISLVLAVCLGIVAGYQGGWIDAFLVKASEVFIVLPWFYVVVALRAALPLTLSGPLGLVIVFAILAGLGSATPARVFRGLVQSLKNREFLLAGHAAGASTGRLFRYHVLPFLLPTMRTQFLLSVPAFIVTEVTLSFLGLGIAEPTPTWGSMLIPLQQYVVLTSYPWMFAPAIAVIVVCLALQIVAREV
jgi:peptide/nickel transport system permease protein